MKKSGIHPKQNCFWLWISVSFVLGMCSIAGSILLIYLDAIIFNESKHRPTRPTLTQSELMAQRKRKMSEVLTRKRKENEALVDRMYQRYLSDPDSTMNFLVLSGGGQHAAFGSGFLLGWSGISESKGKFPRFDGVTGVSSGSLIAPFAYIGTTESLAKIDQIFRNPGKDFVVPRGHLYFLPEQKSLALVPGLERALREYLTKSFAERIIEASTPGRLLLIQSTNLDLAFPAIFDFIEASKDSIKQGNTHQMVDILLASTAMPGIFPPRVLNGALHVDGGIEGNFYTGGHHPSKAKDTFGAIWSRKHPNIPIPKTVYWVILNGNLREPPKTIATEWPKIAARSLAVSFRSSEVLALRKLFSIAELTKKRGMGEVEVRWVAIEEPLKKAVFPNIFDETEMRRLSDLGKRLGADPSSWNLGVP